MFGFKLMHNQGREVRKAILELGFNPIVVLRSNLLAVYSSEKLAKSRGSGHLKNPKSPNYFTPEALSRDVNLNIYG